MQKKQHFIEVKRTAEYYTLQPEETEVEKVLFVIHGYSQLPEFFINHFRNLPELGIAVVAPSGLSLSYQSGFYGRVGASWMTKHNRENEIKDYLAYLDQLYAEVRNKYKAARSFSVLGFSQGTATASRWFAASGHQLDHLLLTAGYVAEDADLHALKNKLGEGEINFFVGKNDSYMKTEKVEAHKKFLEGNGLPYTVQEFDGGHEIPKEMLLEFMGKFWN